MSDRLIVSCVLLAAIVRTPVAAASTDFPPATAESQGVSSESLDALMDVVRGYLDRDMILGGELLVIKNRRTVLHETIGWRDRDDHVPWNKGTICNIRSMTKPLTGAAAQILIDRGQLALDDPVHEYVAGFDNDLSRAITVEQLLTHRSGLPLTVLTTAIDQYDSLQAQANAAGVQGPEFEPGAKFWYSDAGSDVLGAVVESVSGRSLDEFVRAELLEPLDMRETFYALDAMDERFQRIASLYVGTANAWSRFWAPDRGPLYPFAWGSQTLYGTPVDYAKFLAMWMDDGVVAGRRVLSMDAIRRTLAPVSEMSMLGSDERYPTYFTGLEVWYGRMAVLHMPAGNAAGSSPVVIGHSGSDGTVAWAWPDEDLMILYFTQSRGGTTALRLEEAIDRLLLHPDRVVAAEEVPEELEPFVGTYIANFASFENETFEVLVRNGRLALDIPSQMVFELLDPDEDGRRRFAISDTVAIGFERDEAGAVSLMRIYQGPMVFDVPRAGTELAEQMSRPPVVDPAVVQTLLGTYHDPDAGGAVEVYLEDDVLCIKAPPGIVFHLRPTEEPLRWNVKQMPMASLTFETDDEGRVVSMTRHIGEEALVMPRTDGEEGTEAPGP